MSILRACTLVLILGLLFIHDTDAYQGFSPVPAPSKAPAPAPVPSINCTASCGIRCSKTKRPNLCKRACGSCCHSCGCVPPGTSGNYEFCPCYFNLKTHNDTVRKCP